MMFYIFVAIVTVLVYWGIYCLIEWIDVQSIGSFKSQKDGLSFVILIKNEEDRVENIVKVFQKKIADGFGIDTKVYAIDMDSQDETYRILEKMSKQNPTLNAFTFEERYRIFNEEKN